MGAGRTAPAGTPSSPSETTLHPPYLSSTKHTVSVYYSIMQTLTAIPAGLDTVSCIRHNLLSSPHRETTRFTNAGDCRPASSACCNLPSSNKSPEYLQQKCIRVQERVCSCISHLIVSRESIMPSKRHSSSEFAIAAFGRAAVVRSI